MKAPSNILGDAPSLYTRTGNIADVNTLLVGRAEMTELCNFCEEMERMLGMAVSELQGLRVEMKFGEQP